MTHYHEVYGLCIAVNKPLPLLISKNHCAVDVTIDLSNKVSTELSAITQLQPSSTENGTKLWHTQDWTCVEYSQSPDLALRFYISKDGTNVISEKPDAIPSGDIESFVVGPILGYVLRIHDRICLHASVLEHKNKSFAIIGHKGAGKSTTAAALLQAGARLVSDDIAMILQNDKKQFIVYPGYPGTRLMPNVLSTFSLDQYDYKQVVSNNDKRIVPLSIQADKQPCEGWQFQPLPCQLAAIYVLNQRQADLTATQIMSLPKAQACIALTPHGYAGRSINKQQKNQEFEFMALLSRSIPIKSVDRPDNLECLPDIADALLHDFSHTSQRT